MDDTVSRQAVLNALDEIEAEYVFEDGHDRLLQYAKAKVAALHSDNSERKRGKWDFIGDQMFRCTCCGEVYSQQEFESIVHFIKDSLFPGYCPNCGADMKGEQNE